MEKDITSLLQTPIRDLGLSCSLVHWLESNRFTTLQDVVSRPMHEWFQWPGYTQHGLNELLNFLERRALLSLVKD